MAVTITIYDQFKATISGGVTANFANAPIDYGSDTLNVGLVTNTYAPNATTDAFWSTPVTNELANGSGYTTNGATLASKTVAVAAGLAAYDAADVAWTFTATVAFRYAVLYDRTPATDATRPLIAYIDFVGAGSNLSVPASTFTLVFNVNGIFAIS